MRKNKIIMLPREVVEQALEALLNEGEFRKLLKPLIEKSIDSIRDALKQPDAETPATAPAGWKLVPVEPTDEMVEAGDHEIEKWGVDASSSGAFRAMLAAAPYPPAVDQPQANSAPYLYYDPASGDTWTQEAINDGLRPPDGLIALYTRPHRTPLTDERIDACFPVQWEGEFYKAWRQEVGRAIERAHGIGG